MTKKKSNGFMHFADSRRHAYEAEAGRALGSKRLVDRAAQDWTRYGQRMPQDEQDRWKVESRRRQEPIMPPPGLNVPAHALHQSQRQKQRVMSQLEKELIERARERGVNRHTARQTLIDRLTWRDGDTLEAIRLKRWNLVVLSDNWVAKNAPEEICCFAISNGNLSHQMRIVARTQDAEPFNAQPTQSCVRTLCWNPHSPGDVNNISVNVSKFFHGGWSNLILMPSHQMSQLSSVLHWMKETRDAYCRRDTTSIRLDRLMCIEDVISVFRVMHNKPAIDSDDDEPWEQLKEMEVTDTMLYGRAACEYFISSLAKSTDKTASPLLSAAMAHLSLENAGLALPGSSGLYCSSRPPGLPLSSSSGVHGEFAGRELHADDAIDANAALSEHEEPHDLHPEQNGFGRARMGGFSRNPFAVALYDNPVKDDMPNVRQWLQNIVIEEIEPISLFEPFWNNDTDSSCGDSHSPPERDFDIPFLLATP